MQIFFAVINTLLLVVLFFYQRNRNKVLSEHLSEQRKLIGETKSVVIQQSTALEGQSKVVDTALKYSDAFDPQKIESIIRRELDIDHKEKIDQLKKEFDAQISETESKAKQKFQTLFQELINTAASVTSKHTMDHVMPFIPHIIQYLVIVSKEERDKILESLPEIYRTRLRESVKEIETKAIEIL